MSIFPIRDSQPTWRNALGCIALIVILPVAIVIKLLSWPFEKPLSRSPAEVLSKLQHMKNGTIEDLDYDEFSSCPLDDAELEQIRLRACEAFEAQTETMSGALDELIARAEAIASNRLNDER